MFLIVAALLGMGVWLRFVRPRFDRQQSRVSLRGSGDIFTIAATGDTAIFKPLQSLDTDSGFASVVNIVRSASLSVTNLDENLLDSLAPAQLDGSYHKPYGTKREAEGLKLVGFSVLSLANNHALDYGVEGMNQTSAILDSLGLLHTGSGSDLGHARTPVYSGTAPHRVAVFAVATSAAPESRATFTRGEILGRPGVSALKYSVDVTLDPTAFANLQKFPVAEKIATNGPEQFTLSGTTIKKGPRTVVQFVLDERDVSDILSRIRNSRSSADFVVVMIHSHEPSNTSQMPADFVQQFARAAVDAGANLIVGQGPHQLRGIEVYKQGVIFYSLGNFAVDYGAVDQRSTDVYDAGTDLYQLAVGAVGESEALPAGHREPVWRESIIALTAFDHSALKSVRLQPIDLGVDLTAGEWGIPRIASPERGREILSRLARLSEKFNTHIRVDGGTGVVELETQSR